MARHQEAPRRWRPRAISHVAAEPDRAGKAALAKLRSANPDGIHSAVAVGGGASPPPQPPPIAGEGLSGGKPANYSQPAIRDTLPGVAEELALFALPHRR